MFCVYLFIILLSTIFHLSARDQSSVVSIAKGASFVLDKPLKNFKGTLALEESSTITGEMITFRGGVLQDADGSGNVTARVSPHYICLEGDQTFRGNGVRMLKTLIISGTGNRLEAGILPADDILLTGSNASVTMSLIRALDKNIQLNGGSIDLEQDIQFSDRCQIIGPGTARLNGKKLVFGTQDLVFSEPLLFDNAHDIEIASNVCLSCTVTFSGYNNLIVGHTNLIDLDTGTIVVQKNSSLALVNIVLKNVSTGAIVCMDDTSTLTLQNVVWIQDDDYTFSSGALSIVGYVEMRGKNTFAYQSTKECTIQKDSMWLFDYGITLSYDPLTARKDLLTFEDSSATLMLDGATLYVTPTGLQLTKGTFLIDEDCSIITEKEQTGFGAGLEIGNQNGDEDLICRIMHGSRVELEQGDLIYSNSIHDSWHMYNSAANIKVDAGARLYLKEPLDLEEGILHLSSQGILQRDAGKVLSGSVHVF